MRTLIAIPVYNEQQHVTGVLEEVRRFASDILVIDDGSTDDTPLLIAKQPVEVIRHARNRGYGCSMIDAFRWGMCYRYDWVITMDCDRQHEPASLPVFHDAIRQDHADVISGSRYLNEQYTQDRPPADRRQINATFTSLVNDRLSLNITDAFCGFKAYRTKAVEKLALSEQGYAFPLQFWVQAAAHCLRITEVPIRLIYNDPNRSFGGPLDNADLRLKHYRQVFDAELAKLTDRFGQPCACASGTAEADVSEQPTNAPTAHHAPSPSAKGHA